MKIILKQHQVSMKVGPNYLGVLFRIFFFLFVGAFTVFVIKRNFIDTHYSGDEQIACIAYLLLISFFWVCYILSFRGIFKVVVDTVKSEIELSFLFRKEIVRLEEIEGYYVNQFVTRGPTIEGIILKLKSGRLIHLNEFELESLFKFNQFITSKDIPCLGKTLSRFYPFRISPK